MNLYDKSTLVKALSFFMLTMVASVPLLQFALSRSQKYPSLMLYYAKHTGEEVGHDAMLEDDLHRLGVTTIPRSYAAAQFAGSQYYLIAHVHPAMLLGYMRALEKDSLPLSVVDDLSRHHGVELKALRHHAEHDPQHKADLDAVILTMPDDVREGVEWNERCTTKAIVDSLNGEWV